jgi:Coenzyme PQQ synthesis protein D (PqqD)
MNEPADHPKRRTDVNVRMIDGEVVVLDRQAGLIHQLNQTASYIWDRCDGQSTVAELADQLAVAFDVDANTAVHDVATLIVQLHRLGLIESPNNMPGSP